MAVLLKQYQWQINMDKEQAREQFNRVTEQLGLVHTFTFDEAWEFMEHKRNQVSVPDYRVGVVDFENKLKEHPNALTEDEIQKVNPLKHSFADGLYAREIFNPQGELIVTKIHKVNHFYFLLKGDMSILTENGPMRIKAPHYGVTKAGTKRIIYTHEDCVFVTVHATKETDIGKIEDEVVAKDFSEIQDFIDAETIQQLRGGTS